MSAPGQQPELFLAMDGGAYTARLAPIPELPPEDGYLTITKNNLNTIARRITPLDVLILQRVACRTTSARRLHRGGPRPRFGDVSITELQQFTGASVRVLCARLAHLEKIEYLGRERPDAKTHRGGMRVLVANFRKQPLIQPKAPKHRVRTAAVLGPREEARSAKPPLRSHPHNPTRPLWRIAGRIVFTEEAKLAYCKRWLNPSNHMQLQDRHLCLRMHNSRYCSPWPLPPPRAPCKTSPLWMPKFCAPRG
jgi:hypothetical protein